MLKKIRVRNFKPFGEVDGVRLAPITLVYGPNSSGKSSLIQSLLLMSQSLSGQQRDSRNDLITRGSLVDLGNFSSILHRHDLEKSLRFEFEFDTRVANSINSNFSRSGVESPFSGVSIEFANANASQKQNFPVLSSVGFRVRDFHGEVINVGLSRPDLNKSRQFDLYPNEVEVLDGAGGLNDLTSGNESFDRDGTFKFDINPSLEKFAKFLYEYGRDFPARRLQGVNNELRRKTNPDPNLILDFLGRVEIRRDRYRPFGGEYIPSSLIFDEANSDDRSRPEVQSISEVLRSYDRLFRNSLVSLSYLGPLRTHPARHYLLDGVPGDSVGTRGEQAVQILFHDLESGNGVSPLLSRLNEYCSKFEIPYKFDLRNLGDPVTGDVIVLSLTDVRTNVRVGPADVGFGIGQLLPILIEGLLVNDRRHLSKMVCVEQPEIHLHPRLQAAMADFFIDTAQIKLDQPRSRLANRPRGSVQWVLETHSEALMLRLQRRIREKIISHEDISVLYVDPRGEKGSVIQELRLDEDGEFIDIWPDGFFVESLSEILGGR